MSKLLKKLKPGTRVIDIRTGDEGWVTHHTSLPVTVEFFVDNPTIIDGVDCSVRAITYPISDIKNRIKLAPKYENYKIGDRVKISNKIEDYVSDWINKEGVVEDIVKGILIVKIGVNSDYCYKNFTKTGLLVDGDYYSNKPVLKKLKVKKPK